MPIDQPPNNLDSLRATYDQKIADATAKFQTAGLPVPQFPSFPTIPSGTYPTGGNTGPGATTGGPTEPAPAPTGGNAVPVSAQQVLAGNWHPLELDLPVPNSTSPYHFSAPTYDALMPAIHGYKDAVLHSVFPSGLPNQGGYPPQGTNPGGQQLPPQAAPPAQANWPWAGGNGNWQNMLPGGNGQGPGAHPLFRQFMDYLGEIANNSRGVARIQPMPQQQQGASGGPRRGNFAARFGNVDELLSHLGQRGFAPENPNGQ